MRKIIKGKVYNTKTAEIVAYGDNRLDIGDCWRQNEELYMTKKGAYFICNQAGNLIPVNKDGSIDKENYYENSIVDWLENWNVEDLEDRELKAFNITTA